MSRLIVNADDCGLTGGVNRAIEKLHRDGVLPSASLMAVAAATEEAIQLARAMPSLGVGCHVVLVDGTPALSAPQIPHLADPIDGRFRGSLAGFLQNLFCAKPRERRALIREIEAETAAQIAILQNRGLRLTHIDTHKHTHMFAAVLRPVLRAARAAGIRAVRNPFEPAWSLRATPGNHWIRRAEITLLRRLEPAFRRIVAEEGFSTTDGCVGILATGSLDETAVGYLMRNLPPGTWELVTHPGYNDADLAQAHTRLLASREKEQEALQILKRFPAIPLISFADLTVEAICESSRH